MDYKEFLKIEIPRVILGRCDKCGWWRIYATRDELNRLNAIRGEQKRSDDIRQAIIIKKATNKCKAI